MGNSCSGVVLFQATLLHVAGVSSAVVLFQWCCFVSASFAEVILLVCSVVLFCPSGVVLLHIADVFWCSFVAVYFCIVFFNDVSLSQ